MKITLFDQSGYKIAEQHVHIDTKVVLRQNTRKRPALRVFVPRTERSREFVEVSATAVSFDTLHDDTWNDRVV